MLNAPEKAVAPPQVVDYVDGVLADHMANGQMNTEEPILLENIASAIRRGHPQMRTGPMNPGRICLVGSGPSLAETVDELRALLWEGATLVTLNGAYNWCIEHNLRPQTQIVVDARPSNTRFLNPPVPKCNYVLASQCAPELWDELEGRPNVWIFHAILRGDDDATRLLDAHYHGQWLGVSGGTTVATRALVLLRMAGYVRFDLFGIDCCWLDGQNHVLPQPENDKDQRALVRYDTPGDPLSERTFSVSPWQLKQFEDFMTLLKINGQHMRLSVHGRGLLAHAIKSLGTGEDGALTALS